MEYQGMPLNWSEYYEKGFRRIAEQFSLSVTAEQLDQSSAVMRSWNPRIRPREEEEDPGLIFEQALAGWDCMIPVGEAVEAFFDGLELRAEIYPDTLPALRQLHAAGWTIAALTDLPTAMPDELFKRHIQELLPFFDCYVSSQSCGFRKPNPAGRTGSPKNIMSPSMSWSLRATRTRMSGQREMLIAILSRSGGAHIRSTDHDAEWRCVGQLYFKIFGGNENEKSVTGNHIKLVRGYFDAGCGG